VLVWAPFAAKLHAEAKQPLSWRWKRSGASVAP
jgi:hypothetical protein